MHGAGDEHARGRVDHLDDRVHELVAIQVSVVHAPTGELRPFAVGHRGRDPQQPLVVLQTLDDRWAGSLERVAPAAADRA